MTTYLAPRDHTVTLGGLALHYCEGGAPAAHPVVLLHGVTGHARTWDNLATALQPGYRVIALDQRGHGDSQWAPGADYSVAAMATDVERLADRVSHGLTRLPDGGLAWKYDTAIREAMRLDTRREPMNLWEPLAHIACPTLLVRGAESDILSTEIAKRMLATVPDGRLVEIAGASHTVPGDQPEAFAAAVRSFLA